MISEATARQHLHEALRKVAPNATDLDDAMRLNEDLGIASLQIGLIMIETAEALGLSLLTLETGAEIKTIADLMACFVGAPAESAQA